MHERHTSGHQVYQTQKNTLISAPSLSSTVALSLLFRVFARRRRRRPEQVDEVGHRIVGGMWRRRHHHRRRPRLRRVRQLVQPRVGSSLTSLGNHRQKKACAHHPYVMFTKIKNFLILPVTQSPSQYLFLGYPMRTSCMDLSLGKLSWKWLRDAT